jgi:hypothetical protein
MTEKAKAYTSVTADDWVIADPDPTPRTAATAREALADALMSSYLDERYHGTFLTRADAILDALPDGWTLAAAEATPSEPVGRVPEELRKWLLAVDKEHTGTVPGGLRLRHGRCTTCGMLKVGLDAHPTPATRDE